MKKDLLMYSTVLAALVAQGAEFDRAKLDRMLSELEKSSPSNSMITIATCYLPLLPQRQRTEYLCPVCGKRTFYPDQEFLKELNNAHNGAKSLAALELNIKVDASPFCHECAADKTPFAGGTRPFSGVIADIPELNKKYPAFPPGTPVHIEAIQSDGDYEVSIISRFVHAELIGEDGKLTKNARLRCGPGTRYASLGTYNSGHQFIRMPAQPGDDPQWIRVSVSGGNLWGIPSKLVSQIVQKDFVLASYSRYPIPAWVITIQGTSRIIPIQKDDVELLTAFLTGRERYLNGIDISNNVKGQLPRLRQLLGEKK